MSSVSFSPLVGQTSSFAVGGVACAVLSAIIGVTVVAVSGACMGWNAASIGVAASAFSLSAISSIATIVVVIKSGNKLEEIGRLARRALPFTPDEAL